MKLKFINPASLDKNLKATVHKTGKLGFTIDAAKKLKLAETKSASIALNEDDPNDTCLYAIINDSVDENAFKINKAGEYFYVNTKALFDDLKVDYIHESVVYDITIEMIDGQSIFKFKRRANKKVSAHHRDKVA